VLGPFHGKPACIRIAFRMFTRFRVTSHVMPLHGPNSWCHCLTEAVCWVSSIWIVRM
jgi:hypothetical protein